MPKVGVMAGSAEEVMAGSAVEVMEGSTEGVIFMEAISVEVRASSSGDPSGSPTIHTIIMLTPITIIPITIRTPTQIPITRMLLPSLPCTPNRRKNTIGTTARIRKGITRTSQTVRAGGRGWFQLLPSQERRAGNMKWERSLFVLFTIMVLGGCATMPTGPTARVMPGPGKPFEVFMADDGVCRQWAQQQVGGTSPSQTANENLATGAVIGTVLGAGLGALIGSTTGNVGAGAAIGAGAGLLGGSSIGGNAGAASEYHLQRRYDIAYQQCMYSKGNQIPGVVRQRARAYTPPPPGPPAKAQMSGSQLFIYPRQGQSQEKQANDRNECHNWALGQTGYDPTKPPPNNMPGNQMAQMNADFHRAMGACLDGRGYTVR